ncbi:MAG TPA: C39 family peptidase [Anaerolineae bacterium]|nr:C39 family peptidase [Anaerolineae bacterium]
MIARWLKLQRTERPWLLAALVWLGVSAGVLLLAWAALRWTASPQPEGQHVPAPLSVVAQVEAPASPDQGTSADRAVAMLQEATPDDQASIPVTQSLPSADELALPSAAPSPLQILLDVPRRPQERNLNCEFRSATDLADYFGWAFTWEQLFEVVGVDSGGDPNLGFVGRSINDPVGGLYPSGYGVYAEAIARGLRQLGIPATAHNGKDAAWLKEQLAAGSPVVIWATYGLQPQPLVEWQSAAGVTVRAVRYEHTFVAVGYDQQGIWLDDPWGAVQRHYPWSALDASWALLDNMALTIDAAPTP